MNFIKLSLITLLLLTALPVKSRSADFLNFMNMHFVDVPSGTFNMGSCNKNVNYIQQPLCGNSSANDTYAYDDELPKHSVAISSHIQMATHEVTVSQFNIFLKEQPNYPLNADPDYAAFNSENIDQPVSYVSFNNVSDFINWLNKQKPEKDTGRYRLPTEAEWEYAARAGTKTLYFFSNSHDQLEKFAWYTTNSFTPSDTSPHPSGRKQANPWGLYDIYGNVWEWVSDYYTDTYYSKSPNKNPTGPLTGKLHVIRGGAWNYDALHCRSAARETYPSEYKSRSIGFRLIRDLPRP